MTLHLTVMLLVFIATLINFVGAVITYRRMSRWAIEARRHADEMRRSFISLYGYDPIKVPRAPAPNPPSVSR